MLSAHNNNHTRNNKIIIKITKIKYILYNKNK
jgi:hypothetical protein